MRLKASSICLSKKSALTQHVPQYIQKLCQTFRWFPSDIPAVSVPCADSFKQRCIVCNKSAHLYEGTHYTDARSYCYFAVKDTG